MGQAVSRRSLISVAGFHFSTVRVGFVVEKVALGWVFYLVLWHSPLNIILTLLHTRLVVCYQSYSYIIYQLTAHLNDTLDELRTINNCHKKPQDLTLLSNNSNKNIVNICSLLRHSP